MMPRLLFSLSFCLFTVLVSYAQRANTGSISGTVTDGRQPLPGAVVKLQNTAISAATGLDGRFILREVPDGRQVVVTTFIGFQPRIDTVQVQGKPVEMGGMAMLENEKLMNEVKVESNFKQGSETKAINMMHTSTGITSVLSSDEINKLPDLDAADMVKRMAGVEVQKVNGEGAFVSLRGTPTDWTSTLINGNRMPTADENNITRTFEFQVLPGDLIDYVVIHKSVTADIEGDNIGGSINFITKSAVEERTLEFGISDGYSFLAKKPLINANLTWGDRSKNKKFGYVINLVNNARDYTAQNQNVIYGDNFNQAINRMELNEYTGFRNTFGANAALEYKFTPDIKLSANVIYGNMIDDRSQDKTSYNWSESNGSTVRVQSDYGTLNRQLIGGEIKSENSFAKKFKLTAKVATYWNSFGYGPFPFGNSNPAANGYHVVEFARYFSGSTGYTDRIYTDLYGNPINTSNGVPPNAFLGKFIGSDDPYGGGDNPKDIQPHLNVPLLPQNFDFAQAYTQTNQTKEQDPFVASADLEYHASSKIKITVGGKARVKTGSRDVSVYQWLQNTALAHQNLTLTDFQTQAFPGQNSFLAEMGNNYRGTFMPFLTHSQLANFVKQLGDSLIAIPGNNPNGTLNVMNNNYLNFVGSDYHYTEYAFAGYAMMDAKPIARLSINLGLRMEETMLREYADSIIDSLVQGNGAYYYPLIQQATIHNYLAVLPAMNLNYALKENMNLRFAATRTFHRPNFTESKPGYAQYNYNALEFNFGNPNLKPTYSVNFDVTYEYYWGNKGMFSVGAYYKYVTNHIFATITADADPSTGIIYKSYQNAPHSEVAGAEASFTRRFTFLPRFASGFGINANVTYAYSRMQVPGRDFAQSMPEQTPILYNVALFYEKYDVSARIALNYTGTSLLEVNTAALVGSNGQPTGQLLHQNTQYDVFTGQSYSLDFLISYKFKKHYTVFAGAGNLLDWPTTTYRGDPNRPMLTEYYGQRVEIGFKFNL